MIKYYLFICLFPLMLNNICKGDISASAFKPWNRISCVEKIFYFYLFSQFNKPINESVNLINQSVKVEEVVLICKDKFCWLRGCIICCLTLQTLSCPAAARKWESTAESASSGLLACNGAPHQNLLSCEKPAAARAGCWPGLTSGAEQSRRLHHHASLQHQMAFSELKMRSF